MMTLEQLRLIEDNKHINNSTVVYDSEMEFDDWKPRHTSEYKASYLEQLSELYKCLDENNETEALREAEYEMDDWISVYENRNYHSDYLIAKIHACKDFINGDDPMCE